MAVERIHQQFFVLPIFLLILMILAVGVGKITLAAVGVDSYVGAILVGGALCALIYSMYLSLKSSDQGASVIAVDPHHQPSIEDMLEETTENEEIDIADVSELSAIEFEDLVAQLLSYQGLRVRREDSLESHGFQFLAERRGKTYAVKVVHGKQLLAYGLVDSVIRSKGDTKCDGVVIITDGLFSEEAHQLAEGESNCKLADKDVLERWLSSYRYSSVQRAA